jgi:magnesium chelatase subunit I
VVPRMSDIYAALPGITGKLELEYEGEMKGADVVVKELIRTAIGKIFDKYFSGTNTQQIEQWFNLGGAVRIDDDQPSAAILEELKQIQGLFPQLSPLAVKVSDAPEVAVSAAEFLLEGMYAHKRLSRSEERGFSAQEKTSRKQERGDQERDYDEMHEQRRTRRGFN